MNGLEDELKELGKKAEEAYVKASDGQVVLRKDLDRYEHLLSLRSFVQNNTDVLEKLSRLAQEAGKDPLECFSSILLGAKSSESVVIEKEQTVQEDKTNEDAKTFFTVPDPLDMQVEKEVVSENENTQENVQENEESKDKTPAILDITDINDILSKPVEIAVSEAEVNSEQNLNEPIVEDPIIDDKLDQETTPLENAEVVETNEETQLEGQIDLDYIMGEKTDLEQPVETAEPITTDENSKAEASENLDKNDENAKIVNALVTKYFNSDNNLSEEKIAILDSLEKGELSKEPKASGVRELLLTWAGRLPKNQEVIKEEPVKEESKITTTIKNLGKKVKSIRKYDWKGNINAKKLEIIKGLFTLDNRNRSESYQNFNLLIANFRLNQKNKPSEVLIGELKEIEEKLDQQTSTLASDEKRRLWTKMAKLGKIIDKKKKREAELAEEETEERRVI